MRWHYRSILNTLIAISLLAGLGAKPALAQTGHTHGHQHGPPKKNYLSENTREALGRLMVQDFRGRMKPLDTLARESTWKIVKRGSYDGWEPLDMYLSLTAHSEFWFDKPIIAVRNEGLKAMLDVPEGERHVTPQSLYDASGRYRLIEAVDRAHRTPDKSKTKVQRKLLSLDERFNLFHMEIRGLTLRILPIPGDENDRWIARQDAEKELPPAVLGEFTAAFDELFHGLQEQDNAMIWRGVTAVEALQQKYGADVIPSANSLRAELLLNRLQPFVWSTVPYLIAFGILIVAYGWSLLRYPGKTFSLRHPLYALGMIVFLFALVYHGWGYVMRWIASGYAPLSNGYESLIFISLMIGVAGLFYELRSRRASMAALSALLTAVILGVAMLPTFDAAITPLVPVLQSAWLIIHVTVITASYGYLGLGCVVAMTMLILHLFKAPGRTNLRLAIFELNILHWRAIVTGLAFLSVGTFLGGVWANESWGRYWGWDPKETWSLVTILVYAFVVHLRYVPRLNTPLNLAAGGFLSIASVGMTYFGVNYFLAGLHSYAQGDAPTVPTWVYIMGACMVLLTIAAYIVDHMKSWEGAPAAPQKKAAPGSPKRAPATS